MSVPGEAIDRDKRPPSNLFNLLRSLNTELSNFAKQGLYYYQYNHIFAI